MQLEEAVNLLDAFVRYAYNATLDEFKELYDSTDDDYLLSKYTFMQDDLGGFFGSLDSEHRKRFVRLVVRRYAEKEHKAVPIEETTA